MNWSTHSEISEGCFQLRRQPVLDDFEGGNFDNERRRFSASWVEDLPIYMIMIADEDDGEDDDIHGQAADEANWPSTTVREPRVTWPSHNRKAKTTHKVRFARTRGGAVIERQPAVEGIVKQRFGHGRTRAVVVVHPTKYTRVVRNGTPLMVMAHVKRVLFVETRH